MDALTILDAIESVSDSAQFGDLRLSLPPAECVKYLARQYAGSALPISLFVEWVRRNPDAIGELNRALSKRQGSQGNPERAPDDRYASGLSVADAIKAPTVESIVIRNPAEAAQAIGETISTRPVSPADLAGEITAVRGHTPVLRDDGKPLIAVVKTGQGGVSFSVEFLDKRGPIILVRDIKSKRVFNACENMIDPIMRPDVMTALSKLPGSDDEFNFNPFDGFEDCWKVPS